MASFALLVKLTHGHTSMFVLLSHLLTLFIPNVCSDLTVRSIWPPHKSVTYSVGNGTWATASAGGQLRQLTEPHRSSCLGQLSSWPNAGSGMDGKWVTLPHTGVSMVAGLSLSRATSRYIQGYHTSSVHPLCTSNNSIHNAVACGTPLCRCTFRMWNSLNFQQNCVDFKDIYSVTKQRTQTELVYQRSSFQPELLDTRFSRKPRRISFHCKNVYA